MAPPVIRGWLPRPTGGPSVDASAENPLRRLFRRERPEPTRSEPGAGTPTGDELGIAPRERRESTLRILREALHRAGVPSAATVDVGTIELGVPSDDRPVLLAVLRELAGRLDGLQVRPGHRDSTLSRRGADELDDAALDGATWVEVGVPLRLGSYRVANEGYVRVVFLSWDGSVERLLSSHVVGARYDWTAALLEVPAHDRQVPMRLRDLPPRRDPRELGPIDVVYTWVDDRDPAWRELRGRYRPDEVLPSGASDERFEDRDELRFSLRSLHLYAPFVRNVFLVTAGQRPDWLDRSDPRLTVVDHEDIFPDPGVLPVFNSHAIEACLHRIPGLGDRYVYFNDDVLLGREISPSDLYSGAGLAKVRLGFGAIYDGRPVPDAIPTDWAAYRAAQLLERDLGYRPTHKLKHTPLPQLREVLTELEERYPDELTTTRAARFRSRTDLAVPSMFAPHYAIATGRGVEAPHVANEYVFANTGHSHWSKRRDSILEKRPQFFCLNSSRHRDIPPEQQRDNIAELLEQVLPFASPFER